MGNYPPVSPIGAKNVQNNYVSAPLGLKPDIQPFSTHVFAPLGLVLMRCFIQLLLMFFLPLVLMAQTPTNASAQLKGIAPWTSTPLFTIGDSIGVYQPPGTMDGIGARKLPNGNIRLYVNHELAATAGYTYSLENGTLLKGSRVSYFDIDSVSREVMGGGIAYKKIIDRAGVVVSSANQINESFNPIAGMDRLCSASLFKAGHYGLVDDIFFTGEEGDNGQGFALDVNTETLYALPWLGRACRENVALIETGTNDKVALLVGDDRVGAPMTLYIGDKNFANDGSFLDRNGLGHGRLYVWVADNGDLTVQQFHGTGESRQGSFKEIAFYNPALAGTPGYDALGFAYQGKQDELSDALGAFSFARPEDISTNPANGRQVVLASTGRYPEFLADKWGSVYIWDLQTADLTHVTATVHILYAGDDAGGGKFEGPDFGLRSPDNLDWSANGLIYIQEDRAYGEFGLISGHEASVWETNPANGAMRRIAQVDRTAIPEGQLDIAPNELGRWETSGILDVSELFGAVNEVLLLAVVEAHSISGGPITTDTLVEGGQLVLLSTPCPCLLPQDTIYPPGAGVERLFHLFPNPAEGLVNLEVQQLEPGDYTVELYALNGQLVHSVDLTFTTGYHLVQLNLSALRPDLYVIKLATTHGATICRLLMLN